MKLSLSIFSFAVLLAANLGCGKADLSAEAMPATAKSQAPTAEMSGADMASAPNPRQGQTPPVAPSQVPNRAVIRNGALSVRVDSVEKAEDKVVSLVQSVGGYVDSTSSSDLATATPNLGMKIRVPSQRFDEVLDKLEALGTRLSKRISTEDVTASLVDMAARLKIMKAQEEVYRRLLTNSRSNQEMMDIQDKLLNLRGTIEGLEAQHKSLSQLAALSSIELTLQQSAEGAVAATNDPNWAREAWGAATGTLGGAARFLGTGLIWMLVFAPIWLPAAWLARHALRNRPKAGSPSPRFDVTG